MEKIGQSCYEGKMFLRINNQNPQPRLLNKASSILKNGGVLIYPTDTVYGLGCDLYNKQGIEKLHLIKKMGKKHPLTILLSDISQLSEYAVLSDFAFHAIKKSIPGPYTFLLPATKLVNRTVLGKKKIAGFRIPACPITLELLQKHGNPLLNTSVETVTDIMQDPEEIYGNYQKRIDCLIDGGIVKNNPSSVVDLCGEEMIILREGEGMDKLGKFQGLRR